MKSEQKIPKAALLCIGNELTTGITIDTNSSWLAQQLGSLGIEVEQTLLLPDDLNLIAEKIKSLARQYRLLLITGGLGPTEDDLTREALALALNEELVFDAASEEAFNQIKSVFEKNKRTLDVSNRRQAEHPASAVLVPNSSGTAPGLQVIFGSDCLICVMPGVPREMKTMFVEKFAPMIRAHLPAGSVTLLESLHFHGATEAELGSVLKEEMERGKNPTVGTNAHDSVISIRIQAHGENLAAAQQLIQKMKRHIRLKLNERFGDLVFGENETSFAQSVEALLREKKVTVCTLEQATGGLLASAFSGSSQFMGGVVGQVQSLVLPSADMHVIVGPFEQVDEGIEVGCTISYVQNEKGPNESYRLRYPSHYKQKELKNILLHSVLGKIRRFLLSE